MQSDGTLNVPDGKTITLAAGESTELRFQAA